MKNALVLSTAVAAWSALALAGCITESVVEEAPIDEPTTDEDVEVPVFPGLASLSVKSLDFGGASCGGKPPQDRLLRIANYGQGPLHWTASLDSNAYFEISGDRSGIVQPDREGGVTVKAKAMPADVAAGTVMKAMLLVTTSDPELPQVYLPVTATARGASFELVTPEVDFGQVPVGAEAPPIEVMLRNVGNEAATVSIMPPADPQFAVSWEGSKGASVKVQPGDTVPGLTAHFTASGIAESSATAAVSIAGAVCGGSVESIELRGQGLASVAGVSPAVVDFGQVACGAQATPKSITLYNSGNEQITWSASFAKGTSYELSQEAGSIAAGGSVQLTVTPAAMEMTTNTVENGFGDTLTITSDADDNDILVVPIRQTAYGAILKLSASSFEYGKQPVYAHAPPRKLTVLNLGSANADVEIDATSATVDPGSGTVPAGGKLDLDVIYFAERFGPSNGQIGLVTNVPMCQPPPGEVQVTGEGIGVAAAISVGGNGASRDGTGTSRYLPGQTGCAILEGSGGRVACWGTNEYGQLGTSDPDERGPFIIPGLTKVVSVSAGGDFNCAADSDGDVWCWGNNRNKNNNRSGKLGVSDIDSSVTPVKVPNVSNATQVSCGHNLACARLSNGTAFCWGTNKRRNVGTGSTGALAHPPSQVNLSDITQISAGSGGGCATRSNNTVYCWGRYRFGTLGNGSSSDSDAAPTQVSGGGSLVMVTNQSAHARHGPRCAINTSGNAYCWGRARHGQIGNGVNGTTEYRTATSVSGISGATDIAGYYNGACVLMGDKTIRCWGKNQHGQVGDGTTTVRTTPVQVVGIDDATDIAAGGKAACAIVGNGSVKCWGDYGLDTSSTPKTLPFF